MANKRILVVDDQPMVAQTCAEILADAGYQVDLACSGREALAQLQAEPYDLLVSDLKMPEVDGLTVLRRAKDLYPNLTAIMITSYASLENAIEALRAGARDFLMKPFDPDDLVQTVESVLAAQQREQETLALRYQLDNMEENLRQERDLRSALQAAESLYHNLVETSQDLIWQCDADGTFTYLNQAWRETLGYELEEMLGRRFFDFQPAEHAERDGARFAQGLKVDSITGYETVCLTKDGRIIDLIFNAKPMYDENANVIGAHGTAHDISERKRTEEMLRQSEEDYHQLFEAASDAILLIDNETGQILQANNAACTLYGYGREEMLQKRNADLSAEPEQTQHVTSSTPIAADRVVTIPLRYHRKVDGTVFPVEITGRFFLHQGRSVHVAAIRDITERTQAEAALHESEERYRSLVENAPDAICIHFDDRVVLVNQACLRLFGASHEAELLDKSIYDLFHPDYHSVIRERIRRQRDLGEPVPLIEETIVRLDGSVVDVETSASPFPFGGGRAVHVMMRDITERKQAEQALRQSEEKYRSLVEQIPAMVYLSPFPGSELEAYVSPYSRTLGGYDPEQFNVPGAWRNMVHPDDLPRLDENYQRALQTDETVRQEFRAFAQDGRQLWVQETYWTVHNDAGHALYQQGIVLDITEYKQAEAALRESEERYRSLVENAPDGIYIHFDDRVILVNQACLQLFGARSEEELIGKSIFELFHPDSHPIVRERVARLRDRGEPAPPIEEKIVRMDGRVVDVETSAAPYSFSGGKAVHVIMRDISERKRAEEETLRNEARLKSLVDILQHKALSTQAFLDFALDQAIQLTDSKIGYIYFYDEDTRQFTLNAWSKGVLPVCSITDPQTCYELDKTGIWGEAVRQRQPIVLNDFPAEHPLKKGYPEGHAPLYKYVTVPILDQERIVAVVGVANKEDDYHETDVLQLTLLMDAVWKAVKRKQAEDALHESEERYRRISELISDYAYAFRVEPDQALRLEWNVGGFEQITGFTLAESEARGGWGALIHPDDRPAALERARRLLAGQQDASEFRIVRKDGQVRWLRDHGYPIYDAAQGRVTRIFGAAKDITERKRAEEELRRLKELNENIVQNMAEGVSLTDDQWRIVFANPALVTMLGYTPDELIGQTWEMLIPPDQWDITVAARERRLAGQTDRYEQILQRKDGTRITISVSGSSLFDATTGKFAGALSVLSDITEKKRAEEELRRVKELNEGIVQNMAEGIVMTDAQSVVTFANPALATLLGYAPEELVGQSWLLLVPPEEHAITQESRKRREAGQSDRYEQTLVCRDGTRRSVLISGSPFFDPVTGGPAGVLSVITDITERKQAEEALEERAWQLALLNEIGSQVASLLDLDEILHRAAQLVQERFGFHYVSLFSRVPSEDRLVMRAWAGEKADLFGPEYRIALGEGMVGWVGQQGVTLMANDVDAEPRYYNPYPDLILTRSELSIPIRMGDEILGVLDVQSPQLDAFDPNDVTTLETLAGQIAMAIHNAHLFSQVAQRNRDLTLLNRVIAATAAVSDQGIEPVLEVACRELAMVFDAPQAAAALLNRERTEALVVAEHLTPGRPSLLGMCLSAADHPVSQFLLTRTEPLMIDNAQTDPRLAPLSDLMDQTGAVSLLILPLVVDGDVLGYLVVDAATSRAFTAHEVDLAGRVAEQAAGALARARMQSEQKRLSTVLEQTADGVLITDTQGVILYVNPAFEQSSGYSRAEVVGQTPRILKSGKHDPAFFREMWQTISAGEVWRGRLINRRKDGGLYILDAIITPVRNSAGDIVSYVSTRRDVTRELELEEQFLQAQKMEAIGRLAGGVAHDFNNLLTVIHLSTRMLERNLRAGDPLWAHVQRIQDAGQRASNLTKQLLAFSRREVVEPQVLDLNQVLEDLDKMLRRLIGEDVEMTLRPADDLWAVRVDPTQVEQVVVNLAVNARDAMPTGGKLTIETANVVLNEADAAQSLELEPGEYVLLTVRDNGTGMSDEVLPHLFEPFFTTKERGKGTGLGLATVFGIVKQGGGHIDVHSEVGKGTTFEIYLPRDLKEVSALPDQSSAEKEPLTRGSETLLLVEDERELRELVREILTAEGYQVLAAQDGVQALQIAQAYEGPIDLLITDVVMPHMSGKALADQLESFRPETRVLFTSGYTDDAIVHHGVLDEGVQFLSKPFEMEALIRKVSDVLGA